MSVLGAITNRFFNPGWRAALETWSRSVWTGGATAQPLLSRGEANRLAAVETAHAREMTEALRREHAMGDLLAKVSHEMRTPLTSILSIGEMMEYGVYGPLSPEQKDAVRLITECTQTMTRLVNDLLDQSELERGQFHLEECDFSLEEVVSRLRKTARPKATSKGLWLTFEISPEMPATLHGDSFRLTQVLQNLVDNAIKYTHTGKVAIRFFPYNDQSYCVQVSDSGVGIPTEKMLEIFEPFKRVDQLRDPGGSERSFGLGLAIVRQLVTLMKGEIRVNSEVGKGSVFTVRLPIR